MNRFYNISRLNIAISILLILTASILGTVKAHALPADHYAANSVLSEGRWMKVRINETGMQLISNADLKALGFSDPSKVNVYGTGGRMVREALTSDMPDDLPLIESVHTSRGIIFFGVDNITWSHTGNGNYSHTLNPYCAESYYFLSDREIEKPEIKKAPVYTRPGGSTSTTFKARLLHERDMQAPSEAGRLLLGEDFRSTRSQTFNFNLTDIADSDVSARIAFGARTSSGTSSILVSANGQQLPATNTDKISACDDEFIKTTISSKSFTVDSDKLALGINYSYSGALFTARLDYIEVFYDRNLRISNGELHFYSNFSGGNVMIEGCSAETRIWEVSDPCDIKEVEFTLDGDKASFSPAQGYREYVAFDPSKAGRAIVRGSRVNNQDIHSMPAPDMVIIAYDQYADAAKRIARLHEETDGFNVAVLTPEAIYNEFSGGHPDVGAFRKLLKMWYDRGGERTIKYCLLLGRGSYDTKMVSSGIKAAGYRPLPLWQSPTGVTEVSAYSTDHIIGMLDDVTEQAFNINSAKMHVAVGRIPVTNVTEADNVAAKLEKYIKSPNYGTWRNRVMLIADDQDNGLHLRQTEDVYRSLYANAPNYHYEKLYLDSYPLESTSLGMTYPKAKERMMRLFDEGVVYTNYVGHASTNSWTHEKLLTWKDIISFTNKNLPFYYGATCSFGYWDGDNVSGAEVLVLNPDGGFIGAICPSRTVFMTPNGDLNKAMADYMLTTVSDGGAMRVGDVFVNANNRSNEGNSLRYCLISDPALRIPKPSMKVDIESINGLNISSTSEFPELKALGNAELTGRVINPDGSTADGFNGTVTLDLFDAEKVVETYGNGKEGQKEFYNDRKTKLTSVSAKVINGIWKATLKLPAEIDNNYSPAKITAYAWSDKGVEAQGSTESLYVYGYEDVENPDTNGPVIDTFYLNYPEFAEGMMVNANPVVHASFHDESGINISDSGIGHKMSVTLDGKKVYDDVSSYYTSDAENPLGGYIAYPLSDLTAGDHTLKLTVYDNANNATSKSIDFTVGAVKDPVIRNLATDVNPASVSVVFSVAVDHPNTSMKCHIEVFELSGKRVWDSDRTVVSDLQGGMQTPWDLCDSAGRRVARGIYLYRATVQTPDGMYSSQTKKLAVTAK